MSHQRPFTNGPSHLSDGMISSSMCGGPSSQAGHMRYKVIRMRFITRDYVRANRNKLFLFGDNLEQRGFGGQAAAMRGEPNAIGIPTKRSPSYAEAAFFTDNEFEQNKAAIDLAFARIAKAVSNSTRVIVIPSDGLGTGRAELAKRAPRTFAYLQSRLTELSDLS
ncbi:hypothetical protein [Leptolyngbya sp. 7M]|uniref:DUF7831 domain-containing protein n=1 Tax=Leptolyngbya sp. 7M TaxID=2812896 RepID=UPI001B8BAAF7|nr:hypothetical protein [Leptolyngbya sp. 7M]QYO68054.1 hypothetical protein JVX88_15525 [Leptolyngbya sp. 7M]